LALAERLGVGLESPLSGLLLFQGSPLRDSFPPFTMKDRSFLGGGGAVHRHFTPRPVCGPAFFARPPQRYGVRNGAPCSRRVETRLFSSEPSVSLTTGRLRLLRPLYKSLHETVLCRCSTSFLLFSPDSPPVDSSPLIKLPLLLPGQREVLFFRLKDLQPAWSGAFLFMTISPRRHRSRIARSSSSQA